MLLLTFTGGANRYAVDAKRVVEVVPRVELRTVPHAPVFLVGLLGYSGILVPVLDLGLLLDAGRCRDCLSTRIILVNDAPSDQNDSNQGREAPGERRVPARARSKPGTSLLGLVAEHVSDLTHVQPHQVIPASVWLPQAPYLGPIVESDQGIIQVIMVEKIRSTALQLADLREDTVLDPKFDPSAFTA